MWISRILLLLLMLLLGVQVRSPYVGPTQVDDSYSVENSGRRALFQLAGTRFAHVDRNHRGMQAFVEDNAPYGNNPANTALCLLGPGRYPNAGEWKSLLDWVRSGGRLLIAASMTSDELLEIPELNIKVEPLTEVSATIKPPAATQVSTRTLSGSVNIDWRSRAKLTSPAHHEVLVEADRTPQGVRANFGRGHVVVLASDYIFSNESLSLMQTDNAALAYRLLQIVGGSPKRSIAIDEYLNGAAKPTIEALLLDDALRPLVMQFAVLLLLFGWLETRRFGGLLPKSTPPRRDITDHTNALGNLYYKCNNGGGAVAMYLNQFRRDLKLKTGGKLDRTLLERLARRTGDDMDRIRRLLQQAEGAAGSTTLSRRDAAAIIRHLAELRQKVTTN